MHAIAFAANARQLDRGDERARRRTIEQSAHPLADQAPLQAPRHRAHQAVDASTAHAVSTTPYGTALARTWVISEFITGKQRVTLRRVAEGRDFEADHGHVFCLVATVEDAQGQSQLVGQAHWSLDRAAQPNATLDIATFDVAVHASHCRLGVGTRLLRALLHSATLRGLRWLHARVHQDHVQLLSLVNRHGFWRSPEADAGGRLTVMVALPSEHGVPL
jgi:GNAT superfamily N-acetyltransferase